ncbi:MAG: biotin transporter BioY [Anaerolineae bacterium]
MSLRIRPRVTATAVAADVAGVLAFAALTALGSRITVELPGLPVPLTMQTLAVLLAGLVLGARRGAAGQLAYVAAVASGLPLDARMHGILALAGPTGGYLLGFIAAAAVAGAVARGSRSPLRLATAALAGLAALYLCGATWLAAFLGADAATAWRLGVAPFVGVDMLKAVVAVAVATGVRRRYTSASGRVWR